MTRDTRYWLSVAITVLVGILSLIYTQFSTEAKRLEYEWMSVSILANKPNDKLGDLKFIYRNEVLKNAYLLILRISNSGGVPIKRDDFDGDLSIRPQQRMSVLNAVVGTTRPESMVPQIRLDKKGLTVSPLLLNPGDWFNLELLVTGESTFPTVHGRIAGVQAINERRIPKVVYQRGPVGNWLQFVAGLLLMSMAVSLLTVLFTKPNALRSPLRLWRWEALLWAWAGLIGGWSLIGYWGENVSFILKPQPWANIALFALLVPLNVIIWLRIRRALKTG